MSDFYKKIVTSRRLRLRILQFFTFIPDKTMVAFQYWVKLGRKVNWKNPRRLTEKIVFYKLFYRNPLMIQCADKNDVRDYVSSCGCGEILNERYGIYDSVEEIDFDALPSQFVLKDTLGSGGNSVIVCLNKDDLDLDALKKKLKAWVDTRDYKRGGREWPYYSGKKHRILVEKYIDSSSCPEGLVSYKLFCFNGKVEFLYLIVDIKKGYMDADYGIYSPDFEKLPVNRVCQANLQASFEKPENWDKMIEIAGKLSKDFPHVRVDLYNVQGKIYFGELTFFNDSGYFRYNPDEYDFIFGEKFNVPKTKCFR